ncbi:hypothetical protein MRB53_040693 [Persea americana]|nr:hypothetical protein MRB53_040693 [Persea americana]
MATYTSHNPLYEDDPKTVAIKSRILTHMTADHAESLALYLRHYCKQPITLPPTPAILSTLALTDITPTHMIITHPSGRSLIPFTPPMAHLSGSRARLVQMHTEALRALHLSDLKVSTFVLPNKAWQWFTHFCTLLCFTTFSIYSSASFRPESDTLASRIWSVGGLAPWLGILASWTCKPVLVGMVLIHGAEVWHFQRSRLRTYWVAVGSVVWWCWVLCVFSGGVAGIWRFDEMVEGIRAENAAKQKGKGQEH